LIWTDGDETDGPLHAGFKLSKEEEDIGPFFTAARSELPLPHRRRRGATNDG
jgi:hypothetical protein